MLTKLQVEEIRARAEKATKGPWHAQGREIWQSFFPTKDYRRSVGLCWRHPEAQAHLDANFIAAAREDVPAILADNDALRERNQKLERVAEAARECLKGAGMAHYPHNVHVNYCKYEFLRGALFALDAKALDQTVAATVEGE